MAYVYLIRAHNSGGLHKIGKTIDIDRRMRELKAAAADRVEILELPTTEAMDSAEKDLHRLFAGARIPQSEMFNLSLSQVAECRQAMEALRLQYAPTPEEIAEQQRRQAEAERRYVEREAARRREAEQREAEENRILLPLMTKIREHKSKASASFESRSNRAMKGAAYAWLACAVGGSIAAGTIGIFFLFILLIPVFFFLSFGLMGPGIPPLQLTEEEKQLEAQAREKLRLIEWKERRDLLKGRAA